MCFHQVPRADCGGIGTGKDLKTRKIIAKLLNVNITQSQGPSHKFDKFLQVSYIYI